MGSDARKDIVVVGGSVTALMTAIPLLRLGHNVTLLERTPSSLLKSQGAGIASHSIAPPIISAFKAHGKSGSPTVEFFEKYDRTGHPWCHSDHELKVRYFKRDGSVKAEIDAVKALGFPFDKNGKVLGGTSWDLLYYVLRANFDGQGGNYLAGAPREPTDGIAKYLDGVKVIGLKDLGEKVEVQVEGGNTFVADFVIGADGPSSFVRSLLEPESERTYAGYVMWRGTLKESELSEEAKSALGSGGGIYQTKSGVQVILYRIPGQNGTLKDGDMLLNIVKYETVSPEQLSTIMTDAEGLKHKFSLGVGKIDPEVARTQIESSKNLPPALYELYSKVPYIFIQAVTDSQAKKAVFFNNKVILAGDALATIRPHTTAGTGQGAFHALLLEDVFAGKMTLETWEEMALALAGQLSAIGKQLGELCQKGTHPMAEDDSAQ